MNTSSPRTLSTARSRLLVLASVLVASSALTLLAIGCGDSFDGSEPTVPVGGAGGTTTPTSGTAGSAATGGAGAGGATTTSVTSGGGGAGGQGGGGLAHSCWLPGLQDRFDGEVLSALWDEWPSGSERVGVENGFAYVELPASDGTSLNAGFGSHLNYDLTECAVWVEVVGVTGAMDHAEFSFGVVIEETGDWLGCQVIEGLFSCDYESGDPSGSAPVVYDPDIQRWWRIREAGGTTYLETSTNGWIYATVHALETPEGVGDIRVNLEAGSWGNTAGTFRVEFDNVDHEPDIDG